jgi:hypothetical protein
MTTVTDADREIVESFWNFQTGQMDKSPLALAQMIARHREAAEQRARLEGAEIMREAAAKDAEEWFPGDKKTLFPKYGVVAAIRHLDPAAIIAQHKHATENTHVHTGMADPGASGALGLGRDGLVLKPLGDSDGDDGA